MEHYKSGRNFSMPAFGPSTLQTAPQDGPVLGKRKTKVDAPPMPGARVG